MESLITETVALLFFVWDANEAPQRAIAILFARYVKELSIHVQCIWLAESINRWMERVAVSGGLSPLPGLIWEIVILVGHVNFTLVRKKSEFQKLLAVVMMILQLISNFSCKNGPRILKWRWEKWICYIAQAVFKRECFSSLLTSSYYTEVIIFNIRLSIITKLQEQWHPCSFTIQFIHELAPRSLWLRLKVVTVFRYKKKA